MNEVVLEQVPLPVSPVLLHKLPFHHFSILIYRRILKSAMALTRQGIITTWRFKFKKCKIKVKVIPRLNLLSSKL
jgi:hypothetical protein